MRLNLANSVTVVDPTTGELVTKNANFLQLYKSNVQLLRQMITERPAAANIFFWICELMDEQNALVTSNSAICEALDLHRNTVSNSIAYLKKVKVLKLFKVGSCYVYALNNEVVWQDENGKKPYARFNAKIYIVKSEQEPEFKAVKVGVAVRGKVKKQTGVNAMPKGSSFETDREDTKVEE